MRCTGCVAGPAADRDGGAWPGWRAAFAFGLALALPLLLLFAEYEPLSFNIHKGESGIGLLTDPPSAC